MESINKNVISGIYIINNKINNHKYIGSSSNLKKRWIAHRSDLRNNKHHSEHLQRAWNKYGKNNFLFDIIEMCDKKELIKREQFYIDTLNPEYNNCPAAGTCLGVKLGTPSLEHRRKLSEALKGVPFTEERCKNISKGNKGKKKKPRTEEYRKNIALAHIGKPLSKEHRKHISDSHKGKILSDEHKKNISKALVGNKRTLGHKLSDEHKKKISIGLNKFYETRKNMEGGDNYGS